MRLSIPGMPGVYYDTNTGSTAIGVAFTAAGRYAPKPKGYAVQLLPYLWSFEVDLREVPTDHPLQYLHPEGARSLGDLGPSGSGRPVRSIRDAGDDVEAVLRFVWSVNRTVESATNDLLGRPAETEGLTIEIQDGAITADGDELATDAFDLEATDRFEDDADAGSFDSGDER